MNVPADHPPPSPASQTPRGRIRARLGAWTAPLPKGWLPSLRVGRGEPAWPSLDEASPAAWFLRAQRRYASIRRTAAVLSWSGITLVTSLLIPAAIVGALCGLFYGPAWVASWAPDWLSQALYPVMGGASVLLGAVAAPVAVLFTIYLATNPFTLLLHVAAAAAGGLLLTWVVSRLAMAAEPTILGWGGYRRPSREEQRLIDAQLDAVMVASADLRRPKVLVRPGAVPTAEARLHCLAVTETLLELAKGHPRWLGALLAHELGHHRRGDALGSASVAIAAAPLLGQLRLGEWLLRGRTVTPVGIFRALVGALIAWPAWVLTRLFLHPVQARRAQLYELEADADTVLADYGSDLVEFLRVHRALDPVRSGYAGVLEPHLPVPLRVDWIEDAIAEYRRLQDERGEGPPPRRRPAPPPGTGATTAPGNGRSRGAPARPSPASG